MLFYGILQKLYKISLFNNSAIFLPNKWIGQKYFVHIHDVPTGFYWCKNLQFFEKIGRWGCEITLRKMLLILRVFLSFIFKMAPELLEQVSYRVSFQRQLAIGPITRRWMLDRITPMEASHFITLSTGVCEFQL